jgi:hypothetical protein
LTLDFEDDPDAIAELVLQGHHERFAVGLDGERFSRATLVNWLLHVKANGSTRISFVCELTWFAGINCYDLTLNFSDNADAGVCRFE